VFQRRRSYVAPIPPLSNLPAVLIIASRIAIWLKIGNFPIGTWKFIGVFDGHGAGHEAVDFVVETLPGTIKAFLASAVGATDTLSKSTVEGILMQCISGIDDRIKTDLVNFFPGGPEQISKLTDDEIKSTIRDPHTGNSYVEIMRARTGTTALVALIDPQKSLYVASLGDCDAVLCMRNALGGWEAKILSGRHNTSNEVEADRVRAAHPNERECIHQHRTLGLITLTRLIHYQLIHEFASHRRHPF